MGFLKRVLGGGDPPPPPWASFLSAADYRAFIAAVEADLRRRGIAYRLDDGFVSAQVGDGETQLGLVNIAQKCHIVDRAEWPATIAGHFSSLFSTQGRDLDALAADFDQVRSILRLRLFPDASTGGGQLGDTVARPLAPDIMQGLVYDFPESTAGVLEEHLAGWPLEEDAVLAIARENTLAEPLPVRETIEIGDGASFEILRGDSFYVASRILGLGDLLSQDNEHGALVAVPNRHILAWHPIVDIRVVKVVQSLIPVTMRLFQEGPGSISSQLYWWRDHEIVHLPVALRAKGTSFTPPDAFVDLLNGLAAPPAR